MDFRRTLRFLWISEYLSGGVCAGGGAGDRDVPEFEVTPFGCGALLRRPLMPSTVLAGRAGSGALLGRVAVAWFWGCPAGNAAGSFRLAAAGAAGAAACGGVVPLGCAGALLLADGGAGVLPLTAGATGGSGSGKGAGIAIFLALRAFNRTRSAASCSSSRIRSSSFRRSSSSRCLSSFCSCSRYTLSASSRTLSCSLFAASRRSLCRASEFLSSARISSRTVRCWGLPDAQWWLCRWDGEGPAMVEFVGRVVSPVSIRPCSQAVIAARLLMSSRRVVLPCVFVEPIYNAGARRLGSPSGVCGCRSSRPCSCACRIGSSVPSEDFESTLTREFRPLAAPTRIQGNIECLVWQS